MAEDRMQQVKQCLIDAVQEMGIDGCGISQEEAGRDLTFDQVSARFTNASFDTCWLFVWYAQDEDDSSGANDGWWLQSQRENVCGMPEGPFPYIAQADLVKRLAALDRGG